MISYNGVDITVTDAGKFSAEINGKVKTLSSLPALKKLIDGIKAPIKAILVNRYYSGIGRPDIVEVVAVDRDRATLTTRAKIDCSGLLPFDQTTFDTLNRMYHEYIEVIDRYRNYVNNCDKFNRATFDRLQLEAKSNDDNS